MQPSLLNFVSAEDFRRFLKEHGAACLHAAKQIGRDCQEAYDVVRCIGLSHSISGRLAKFLLASATDGRITNGVVRARLALTHEDIGQLVGSNRETITRTLAEFRQKNIAEIKGSILTIRNKSALERIGIA